MEQLTLFDDAREPSRDSLEKELKPMMVRVSPSSGDWVRVDPAKPVPEFVLCRWAKREGGRYTPVPVSGRYARLTSDLAAKLGFPESRGAEGRVRYDTIIRLGIAGFVDVVRVSPHTWLIDLDSWYRHLIDCMDNPERWDEGSEDRETYLFRNALGGTRPKR